MTLKFLPFPRVDKFTSGASSVYRVVATDSWLLKVTNYKVELTSLRDAVLSLEASQTTAGPAATTEAVPAPAQLLTIKVVSVREGVPAFSLRCDGFFYYYYYFYVFLIFDIFNFFFSCCL